MVTGTDTDAAQEGSRVGIGPGGKYTVRQLLLFLMMGSGNDVANALARANGGYDKTVAEMNAAAAQLNARDTRAATISGLDGPGQMTSAYDLALIAREAMRHHPFPELIGTRYAQVPGWGPNPGFGIANDNKLLFNYPGALGGKTGFTDDAGNTYVGLAERDGRRLVVTMLGGTAAAATPVDAGGLAAGLGILGEADQHAGRCAGRSRCAAGNGADAVRHGRSPAPRRQRRRRRAPG